MSVKTVRFNKGEESKLKALLRFYKADFSHCIKELIAEKLEDLQDVGFIARIKEGKRSDYLTGQEVSRMFQ